MIIQYDNTTGAFTGIYDSPDTAILNQYRVGNFVESALLLSAVSADTHYISGGVLTARPAMGATQDKTSVLANAADTMTISGIPSGCVVTLYRAGDATAPLSNTVTGGVVTFTTNTVGSYTFVLQLFPKADQNIAVEAK